MAYKEQHLDRNGAKALAEAWGGVNAAMAKKSGGTKKKPAAKAEAPGKKKSGGR